MKAKSFLRGAALVFLFFGALLALVVSAPKQELGVVFPLAPFYQKKTFLVEVESDGNKVRESVLATSLSAAKYARADEAVPINARISVGKSGVLITPENEILCPDGRSLEMDLPAAFAAFTGSGEAESFKKAILFLDVLAAKQEAACKSRRIEI